MILKSIYIENFGKHHQLEYNFNNGVNNIIEQNAWGKTTFCEFIKAMFYGMDYKPRKETERDRYEPWQGGVYGGSIVFQKDDREYKIERTFGKKDKEDTFLLTDMHTGKESSDYSSNIGEELFKIDKDSFMKSVYIPQLNTATAMTDGINAKIGDLSKAKDDINNFEKVREVLEDKKKEYVSQRKNSKTVILKNEIKELRKKYDIQQGLYQATKELERHTKAQKAQLELLESEKKQLNDRLIEQNKSKEDIAVYKNLSEQLDKEKRIYDDILQKYKADDLEEKDVRFLKESTEKVRRIEQEIARLEFDEENESEYERLKNIFVAGTPSPSFFESVTDSVNRYNMLQYSIEGKKRHATDDTEYESLKLFFKDYEPTDDEIEEAKACFEKKEKLQKDLQDNKEKKLNLEKELITKDNSSKRKGLLMVGISLIVVGAISAIFVNKLLLCISFIGFASSIASFLLPKDNRFQMEIDNMGKEIEEKERLKEEYENKYMNFIKRFRVTYSESIASILFEIKENKNKYKYLKEMIEKDGAVLKKEIGECDRIRQSIVGELSKYVEIKEEDGQEDFSNVLNQINENMHKYTDLNDKYNRWNALNAERNHIYREYENIKLLYTDNELDIHSMEEDYQECKRLKRSIEENSARIAPLKEKMRNIDEKELYTAEELGTVVSEKDGAIRSLQDEISRNERDIELQYTKIEDMEEIPQEIEHKRKLIDECNEKFALLDMTETYLTSAKEKFSSRYLGPIKERFGAYVQNVSGMEDVDIDGARIDIDIDLNTKLTLGSLTKSDTSLSMGYQDVIGLALRFSLIDVMYKNEKPVLILDDPFVNLDDDKIANAKKIIEVISEKYQILYFTCHTSRSI